MLGKGWRSCGAGGFRARSLCVLWTSPWFEGIDGELRCGGNLSAGVVCSSELFRLPAAHLYDMQSQKV